MKKLLLVSIALLFAGIFLSCSKDKNPINNDNGTSLVKTTVYGVIQGEDRSPLAGAKISVAGKTATTDANGTFSIADANVPADRVVVIVTKSGYFNAYRVETPVANAGTEIRLSMRRATIVGSVDASNGGKVTVANGATIDLPANSADGSGGTISVAAKYLDPTDSSFYNFFPGDFSAQRTSGTQTNLYSYGVITAELSGTSGQKLQLTSGKEATITYPIAPSMLSKAPATIPLWYFDETLGTWKEDGVATKQGTSYVGKVKHFTDWNCDDTTGTAKVRGRVVDCNGDGVPGIIVTTGQSKVVSKADGSFERRVPSNQDFFITINETENNGYRGPALGVFVSGIPPGQTYDAGNVAVTGLGYITGIIVDCNNNPIAGTVNVAWGNGFQMAYTSTGTFKIAVKANVSATIEASSFQGGHYSPTAIQAPDECKSKSAGQLVACQGQGNYTEIMPGVQPTQLGVSGDGSTVAFGGYNDANVEVYSLSNGQKISTLVGAGGSNNYVLDIQLNANGTRALIEPLFDSLASFVVWNTTNGTILKRYNNMYGQKLFPNADAFLARVDNGNGQNDTIIKVDLVSGAIGARYGFAFTYAGRTDHKNIAGFRSNGTQFVVVETTRDSSATRGHAKVSVWDMTTNTKVSEFITEVIGIASEFLSPDGSLIGFQLPGAGGFTQNVVIYNTVTGAQVARRAIDRSTSLVSLRISPDNASLVYQSNNINNGKAYLPLAYYTIADNVKGKEFLPPASGDDLPLVTLEFSGDGKKIGGTYKDKNEIWHAILWKTQ